MVAVTGYILPSVNTPVSHICDSYKIILLFFCVVIASVKSIARGHCQRLSVAYVTKPGHCGYIQWLPRV